MSRIAVFGEMLVDRFDSGPVVGGAPFNVARHLAAFGHAPLMIGAIGLDTVAQSVLAEFDRFGMRRDGVQVKASHPTGVVDVQQNADGSHQFHIRSDSAWDVIALEPARAAMRLLDGDGWLYSGTLALRSPVSRATGLALLQSHQGRTFVDLNWREGHTSQATALQAVSLADVLKVNVEELEMLCRWLGIATGDGTVDAAAGAMLKTLPLKMLLVTCGSDGAMAFGSDGRCLAQVRSKRAVQVVDTVGAGDSFSAVVLDGLLRGCDMAGTLARAAEFAGHICEVRGAVPVELADYKWLTAGWSST